MGMTTEGFLFVAPCYEFYAHALTVRPGFDSASLSFFFYTNIDLL